MGYIEERKNLGKLAEYLDRMNVPYGFHDIGNAEQEIFPAIICTYRCADIDFDVILYNIGRWLHVKCLIMNLDTSKLTSSVTMTIYEIVLELNYDLPECTFSLFKNNLYIEIDCLTSIGFEDFQAEFHSIGEGIENFINIVKKQDKEIPIKSTKGQVQIKSTKGQVKIRRHSK